MKTVVLLFHPNFEASRINKAFEQAIGGDYTVRHMYVYIRITKLMWPKNRLY